MKKAFTEKKITIGRLSDLADVKIETIRYYERIDVMPVPPRSEGGYRIYGHEHLKLLSFVRRSRELGFPLATIRELLRLVDTHNYTCDEVKAITSEQLDGVRGKIADLKKLEKILKKMTSRCNSGLVPDCPIIDALYEH